MSDLFFIWIFNIMEITVVIACSTDTNLKYALASIDRSVASILVGLNRPSKEVRNIVNNFGVDYIEVSSSNLATIRNALISHAISPAILILDSDCTLNYDCLKHVRTYLDSFDVIKPSLEYEISGLSTKLVATVRKYTTTDPSLLFLPLAFRKSVVQKIGGTYFQENLSWGEDPEFAMRLKKSGAVIKYVPQAVIRHKALSIRQDLASAFRLGKGRYLRSIAGYEKSRLLFSDLLFKNELLKATEVFERYGIVASIYHVLGWRLIYKIGYHFSAKIL